MRTELARVQAEAQKQSFENNGFEEYEFITNSGCCDACHALDGKHFKVKSMMPGDNAPPFHPNCRCSIAAYEDDDEYEAWLDYLDKGGSTAEWEDHGKAEWMSQKLLNDNQHLSDEGDFANSFKSFFGFGKNNKIEEFNEGLERIKNPDVKTLLQQALERVGIEITNDKGSHYNSKKKKIYLSKKAKPETLAHELFHEINRTYGLTQNGMLSNTVKTDYERLRRMSEGYGNSIEKMLKSSIPKCSKRMDMFTKNIGASQISLKE